MATQNGVVVPSKQPSIIAIASAALAAGTMGAMIYKQREKSNMSTKLNKTACSVSMLGNAGCILSSSWQLWKINSDASKHQQNNLGGRQL